MVEVRLHGALAQQFGRVWNLDVQSPAEAVRAIDCGRWGFRAAIMKLSREGMVFRVRSKDHDYDSEDIGMNLGDIKRIDIIPIVAGASSGVRFLVGVALILAAPFTGGASLAFYGMGASLMLGAVTEWLTSKPERPEDRKNVESWSLSGPTNTVDQGSPVPVIYGEVLTGGYTISAGISVAQVTPGEVVPPAVEIGGDLRPGARLGRTGFVTIAVELTGTHVGLYPTVGFTWSYTGFALATARRLVVQGTGALRLELDYTSAVEVVVTDTGTVTLVCNGFIHTTGTFAPVTPATASKTVTVTPVLGWFAYVAP